MGFRVRLNLFFGLMVVVPLLAVGVVAERLVVDAARQRVDARLETGARTVDGLLAEAEQRGSIAAARLVRRAPLARALVSGDVDGQRRTLERALDRRAGARRILWIPREGPQVAVGGSTAVLPVAREVVDPDGRPVGRLEVSGTGPTDLARRVRQLTGSAVAVRVDDRVAAASGAGATRVVPRAGAGIVEAPDGGRAVAVRRTTPRGTATVVLLAAADAGDGGVTAAGVWALLLAMVVLGLAGALYISRALHSRIAVFLQATRRIADGGLDTHLPVQDRDEFGDLAREFERLRTELVDERGRVRVALRRLGEAVGSNLDRVGLLDVVLRAALDGTRATAGRVLLDEELERPVVVGRIDDVEGVLAEAERLAVAGEEGVAERGDAVALAEALRAEDGRVEGVVSIGRLGVPFAPRERELFGYLSEQVSVSVRNVGVHERARIAANRDPLTGLANRRHLDTRLAEAVDVGRRDGAAVALLLLDIDRFKAVNDRHGHPGGDAVLRGVGRVLDSAVRDRDVAARWGGEEFALLLPATTARAAERIAERVRVAIERADTELPDAASVRITASIGVAAGVGDELDAEALVGAADAALYRAKRGGRNRAVTADAPAHEG